MGKISNYLANKLADHIFNTAYTPASTVYAGLSLARSVRNATYRWTASAGGTNEYYLELAAGGNPNLGGDPEHLIVNNAVATVGTIGALAAGQWAYGNNDTLGFNTVYLRLSDGSDPDSKSTDYVLAGGNPLADASGLNEPSGNNYTRKAITFGAAASRRVTQSGTVTYNQMTGSLGWATHWFVSDASSAGNMLAYGKLPTPQQIVINNTPYFPNAAIYVEYGAGPWSTVVINKLFDLAFRNVAYAKPTTYAGVATATLSDSTTGSTVTEPSGGSYARKQININGGASPAWNLASNRAVSNANVVTFATPSAAWGTGVATFVASAVTGGDIIVYDNTVADQAIASGDTVEFAAGALVATLN